MLVNVIQFMDEDILCGWILMNKWWKYGWKWINFKCYRRLSMNMHVFCWKYVWKYIWMNTNECMDEVWMNVDWISWIMDIGTRMWMNEMNIVD